VGPIKIGVVQEQHQQECREKIDLAILVDIGIESSVLLDWRVKQKQRHQCKDQNGAYRIADLPYDIRVCRKPFLYLSKGCLVAEDHVEKEESNTSSYTIAGADLLNDL
jgi:hypothetical protein